MYVRQCQDIFSSFTCSFFNSIGVEGSGHLNEIPAVPVLPMCMMLRSAHIIPGRDGLSEMMPLSNRYLQGGGKRDYGSSFLGIRNKFNFLHSYYS